MHNETTSERFRMASVGPECEVQLVGWWWAGLCWEEQFQKRKERIAFRIRLTLFLCIMNSEVGEDTTSSLKGFSFINNPFSVNEKNVSWAHGDQTTERRYLFQYGERQGWSALTVPNWVT